MVTNKKGNTHAKAKIPAKIEMLKILDSLQKQALLEYKKITQSCCTNVDAEDVLQTYFLMIANMDLKNINENTVNATYDKFLNLSSEFVSSDPHYYTKGMDHKAKSAKILTLYKPLKL